MEALIYNQPLIGTNLTDKAALAAMVVTLEDMKGATLGGGGRSGHVPPGKYALKVASFEVTKTKDTTDRFNFVFNYEVVGPSAQAGVSIITRHPAPIGQHNEAKTGNTFLRNIVLSAASADADKLAKVVANEKLRIKPLDLVGRVVYAQLSDSKQENYTDTSEVKFYVSKEDFEKKPGPESAEQTAAADKGATVTPIHTNGTTAKTQPPKDTSADAFGF